MLEGTPLLAGVWTSVTYDPGSHTTELVDGTASWSPGELVDLLVQPKGGEVEHLSIEKNTGDRLIVWGDLEQLAGGGDTYNIVDPRPGPGSSCVDAADGLAWTETDLRGSPRVDIDSAVDVFDCSTYGDECLSYADIGALERQQ